jgi:hypothetical protein
MNEYDSEVAHPCNRINTSQTTALRPNWAIRQRQALRACKPHASAWRDRPRFAIGSALVRQGTPR